jgi:hypothetical protein
MLLSTIQLYGQLEWAPIGATWYYDNLEGMNPPNVGYIKIESIKDSLINERQVRVLKKTYFTSHGDRIDLGNIYTFIRNDSVYYWTGYSFSLLYIFSAKIGDSWLVYSKETNQCGNDSLGKVKVDSTNYKMVGSFNLKYIYTSPDNNSIWSLGKVIEIIGSTDYMFPHSKNCGVMDNVENARFLRCYYDNQLGTIKFSNIPCDTVIFIPLKTNISEMHNIKIYPNPVFDELHIESSDIILSKILIYNSLGQLIFLQNINSSFFELSLNNYSSGIYQFIIFDNKANYYSKKVIKK